MKLRLGLFLFTGLLIGMGLGLSILSLGPKTNSAQSERKGESVALGLPAVNFELTALDGETLALNQIRGKPVIINFWATWCPPCREEMPLFQKYYEEKSLDLVVLGINVMESESLIRPYVNEMGITFPILLDEKGEVQARYLVRGLPTTFFLDAKGVMRAQHIGLLDETLLKGYLRQIEAVE